MSIKLRTLSTVLGVLLLTGCTPKEAVDVTTISEQEGTTTVEEVVTASETVETTEFEQEEVTSIEEIVTDPETTSENPITETEVVLSTGTFDDSLTEDDMAALKLYLDIVNVNFTHNDDCLLDVYFYDYGGDGTLDMTVRPVKTGVRQGFGGMLYSDDGEENCREYFFLYDDAVERWGYYETGKNSNIHPSFEDFNGDDSWYKFINLGNGYNTSEYVKVSSEYTMVDGVMKIDLTDSTAGSSDSEALWKDVCGYCNLSIDGSGNITESKEDYVYSTVTKNFADKYSIDLSSREYLENIDKYIIGTEDASSILEYISSFGKFDNVLHCRLDAQDFKDMPFETFVEYLKDPNV